jgi:hypothetical protein
MDPMKTTTSTRHARGCLAALAAALLAAQAGNAGAVTVSGVSTSLADSQKYYLVVDGKPAYQTSVQIRLDKLRYYWNFDATARDAVVARAAADGFNTIVVPIHWYEVEPAKDTFSWTILDEYMALASKYDLKLEILWMGQNSGGHVQWLGDPAVNPIHLRVPDYVLYSPSPSSTATTSDYGVRRDMSAYTLDLADNNLKAREKYVVSQLMNHVATWDAGSNAGKHTLVGIQIDNEVRGYNNIQFTTSQIISYMSDVAAAVKESPYVIWTRMNCVKGDTNSRITTNEAQRKGVGTNIDFVGTDLYGINSATVQTVLPYNGANYRMIMESGAEVSTAAIFQLAALSGNNGYRHYDMLGPDGHGLYDRSGSTGFVQHGAYVNDVRTLNKLINSDIRDIALKSNGYGLFVHNWAGNSATATAGVEGIAYTPATTDSQGISISRSNTEIVLMSTKGGTFTYPSTLGVTGASQGYVDADNAWVNQGAVGYTSTSITLGAGQTVRLTRPDTGAVPGIRRQAEFATVGGGATIESSSLGFAGNGYVNLPTTGGYVSFANVDGLAGGTRTLVIRFANGGTAARTVSVTINGVAANVTFPVTGSWTNYQQMTMSTPLASGTSNSVRIQSTGQDGPNVDEIATR